MNCATTQDCQRHIRDLNIIHRASGRSFLIGSMPFEKAVEISEKHQLELYIGRQINANENCMVYVPGDGTIKVVMLVNK